MSDHGRGHLLLVAAVVTGLVFVPTPARASRNATYWGTSFADDAGWTSLTAIGDIDGDGALDIVVNDGERWLAGGNLVTTFLGSGGRSFALSRSVAIGHLASNTTSGALAVADLDEDGFDDVIVGHDDGLTVFLADGAGGLGPGEWLYGTGPSSLCVGDVDHDGHLDLIVIETGSDAEVPLTADYYRGDGLGGLSLQAQLPIDGHGDSQGVLIDSDDDGFLDLVVSSGWGGVPNASFFPGQEGGFGSPVPLDVDDEINTIANSVSVGDFDSDGLDDVALTTGRNSPTSNWIFTHEEAGTFSGPTGVSAYDIPCLSKAFDADGNGRVDLFTAHCGGGWVGVFYQRVDGLADEVLFDGGVGASSPQDLAVGVMIQSRHETVLARVIRLVGCHRQVANTVRSNSSHLPLFA